MKADLENYSLRSKEYPKAKYEKGAASQRLFFVL